MNRSLFLLCINHTHNSAKLSALIRVQKYIELPGGPYIYIIITLICDDKNAREAMRYSSLWLCVVSS